MRSNLSILQRNMLETMSNDAQRLYLRGCDRDEWKACQMAWEWDHLVALRPMIAVAVEIHSAPQCIANDVEAFIKERHFRRYFPDGRAA